MIIGSLFCDGVCGRLKRFHLVVEDLLAVLSVTSISLSGLSALLLKRRKLLNFLVVIAYAVHDSYMLDPHDRYIHVKLYQ